MDDLGYIPYPPREGLVAMSQRSSQPDAGRNSPTGGRSRDEAILIGSSDDEGEINQEIHRLRGIEEQRARLRQNRLGTPLPPARAQQLGIRFMSPAPPLPLPPIHLHAPAHLQNPNERRRTLMENVREGLEHRFGNNEFIAQLLNRGDPRPILDLLAFRDAFPGPVAPPPQEYDTRMTHAGAKPRIGFSYDFEFEQEPAPDVHAPAVRTKTTIIIPDSPPLDPMDRKGKGKMEDPEWEDLEDGTVVIISSPGAGSSSSLSQSQSQSLSQPSSQSLSLSQSRAVEIVEVLDDEDSNGSVRSAQPASQMHNVLVCASCRSPLHTGGDRLWALRCGHMIDSKCYRRLSEQAIEEEDLETIATHPMRPSKRRRTKGQTKAQQAEAQVFQTLKWRCPVSNCGRQHTNERVFINGELGWKPAKHDGAIKVFT